MIPYLLAVAGGYLLGDSMKDSQTFADGGMMSDGGKIKVGDFVNINGRKTKILDTYTDKSFGTKTIYLVNVPMYEGVKKSPMTKGRYIIDDETNQLRKIERKDYVMADGGMMAKGGGVTEQVIKIDVNGMLFFSLREFFDYCDANINKETNVDFSIEYVVGKYKTKFSSEFEIYFVPNMTFNQFKREITEKYSEYNWSKMADGGMMARGGGVKSSDVKNPEAMQKAAVDEATLSKFHKNILGTISFDMQLKGMRKAQEFITYAITAEDAGKPIMVQSDTRIGLIDLATGRGLMSKSHPNGAYFVHYQMDPKTKFMVSAKDLDLLKKAIKGSAGPNVGTAGVVSDNSGASMI
jgi:hypothetical protein